MKPSGFFTSFVITSSVHTRNASMTLTADHETISSPTKPRHGQPDTVAPNPIRTLALVEQLKDAEQDYEFYPTTDQMIQVILDHRQSDAFHDLVGSYSYSHRHHRNILDVGAGAGAFLKAAAQHEDWRGADLLAIEKSKILISQLVSFAKVIGTDFHAQSFLPKQVDLLFCNPPYREYEAWMSRLIKECPAVVMYLVIPQRWKDSAVIQEAIRFREATVTVIGSDDFLDADRRSRAKVDIVCVVPKKDYGENKDLFTKFFLERFGHLRDKMEQSAEESKREESATKDTLVKRNGLIGALVELYDREMERLQTNYDKAASLDASLLTELNLDLGTIINTLSAKLDSLKQKYWEELFRNLDSVTSKLTSKNQRQLLDTIGGFKAVDFTSDNIYAVLLWILEHANQYVDSQILEVFDHMLSHANMHNYKSNQKVYGKGRYRYNEEKPTHVSLDFRIVIESGSYGFSKSYTDRWEFGDYGHSFVMDVLCVANLLGFPTYPDTTEWHPGKPKLFVGLDGLDVAEFKAFKNGNMHIRLSQRMVLALNVAVGKLRGWIRTHEEATTEFGNDAAAEFARDLHVSPRQMMLGFAPQAA